MKLYGIDEYTLELQSIEVVRETPTMYIVDKRISWLSYLLRLAKNFDRIHLTPESAIEAFQNDLQDQIDSKYAQIEKLREQLREFNYLHERE